ncbi:hypothetical protein G3480_00035 [Thiorhodococcus mannitoliphagus]|uniref:Uncharacterized protein n=1 Tax=Thiorhodococcus mannitoliphagus TaxID=329406 RepID=A0A6P1DNF0_9GAMM|nr:hypothetical protein [Thiorhodococcus mannitoliphagus]NEX18723.1 hypothetical protein [Thiorhodococcus mannitoliphagus]
MARRERTAALKDTLAYEAARIMVDQGLTDFEHARRKAAARAGVRDRRNWPSNEAVQEAILTHRRLFLGDAHFLERRELRRHALSAMRVFAAFSPRLVGAALTGTGDLQGGVQMFLFADRAEDVIFALIERNIPWQEGERSFRYPQGQRASHPEFRFLAGEVPVSLIVLPSDHLRHPPLDPVTDRPQRGASVAEVEQMLAEEESDYRFEMGR